MGQRIHVTESVNRILVPRLRELGFRIEGGIDPDRWSEGSYFARERHRWVDSILFGRDKFGHALMVIVSRGELGGRFEYMRLEQFGLNEPDLSYSTQAELDAVLERLAAFFSGTALRWLEGYGGGAAPGSE